MTRGLSPFETDRLSGCLDRLTPHVRLNGVAITGGVGMQLGLAGQGLQGSRDQVADLDLVAASIDAIASGIVQQFLVSHYHAVRPGVLKFMIQLVDPVSRIRIDVFPDLLGSLGKARTIAIGKHSIQVLPLDKIFEHKVQTLSRASQSAPSDPSTFTTPKSWQAYWVGRCRPLLMKRSHRTRTVSKLTGLANAAG